ncbi:MAG: non-heme iron oxygenase ferredoxin subunit [Alphaproteobacteria bacterium]
MAKIEVCKVGDLEENAVKQVEIDDRPPLAVYNLGGEFYCTDDICTHGMASMSDGDIEGEDIVCPWHEGTFNIKTGEATGAPCTIPLKIYKAVIEGDAVFVELPD